MVIDAPAYHAHIYFTLDRQADAAALQASAREVLGDSAAVHPLVPKAVGPHQVPMFEIDFDRPRRDLVVTWLETHHGPFSVLLHPVTGDDHADHADDTIRWLGAEQPLDLTAL